MFFSVIPFSHSIGIQPLLYHGGAIGANTLQIGSLVEIPYGSSLEYGVIAELYSESPIDTISESFARIKTIERIITPKRILAPYQIQMIIEISARYMIPIHRVLAIFLTKPILSRLEKRHFEVLEEYEIPPVKESETTIHIVRDGIVTPDLVKEYTNAPSVVILPDDFAMKPYQESAGGRDDILFVTSDMTDTRRAQAWIDIANGSFSIIYGTRKILYYNLSRYRDIIYVEDALGPDYWHYPIRIRYNDILRIFSKTSSNAHLTILTSVPTLSMLTYFRDCKISNV